jgi:hypothetical protein
MSEVPLYVEKESFWNQNASDRDPLSGTSHIRNHRHPITTIWPKTEACCRVLGGE